MTEITEDAVVFYVSPNGNDEWTGKLIEPNSSQTDGPFATLERARDAVRELKSQQGDTLKRPVTVYLRDGTYFLSEPVVFTPEDSGTDECPVTYEAYQGETVVISGGKKVCGWKQVTVDDKDLWMAEVADVREGELFFRQLWVNGKRATRARYPNTGYLQVAEVPDTTSESPWNKGQTRFRFHRGLMKAWDTITDAEVVSMSRWVESRLPIASVNEEERIVNFEKSTVFRTDSGDLYYVEHAFEFLDEPGEWYLDRREGKLYYMPRPDEDVNEVNAVIPVLSQIIRMEGIPESEKLVENIVFQGITFSHTEWTLPDDRSGFSQAAIGVPGAIYGEGVRHCAFESCDFLHLGTYAVELSRGCKQNLIAKCQISDLGAGGVKLGETTIRGNEAEQTSGNKVTECHIYDGGRVFHSAIGIWVGQSYDNIIARNHIHDFYYSALSVGWTWGYGNALAKGNIVEFNHIHNIGIRSNGDGPILSDMGGIYTLGKQPGTIVRSNVFHDIAGFRYGGWGIYFDEGSTYIVAEKNLVYRTTHGGFHQHYGRENVVRNNVFAFGRDAQVQLTRPEDHLRLTFERNIVYWDEGNLFAGNLGEFNFAFDNNVYWCKDSKEIKFGDMSFEEWQAKGMDKNSMIADPRFVSPDREDFNLKPDTPVEKIGFVPLELSEFGDRCKFDSVLIRV